MLFSHQNDPHRKEGLLTFALIADAKNENCHKKVQQGLLKTTGLPNNAANTFCHNLNGQISQLKASKGDIKLVIKFTYSCFRYYFNIMATGINLKKIS